MTRVGASDAKIAWDAIGQNHPSQSLFYQHETNAMNEQEKFSLEILHLQTPGFQSSLFSWAYLQ